MVTGFSFGKLSVKYFVRLSPFSLSWLSQYPVFFLFSLSSSFTHTQFFPPNLPSPTSVALIPFVRPFLLLIEHLVPGCVPLTSWTEKSQTTKENSEVDSTQSSVDKWTQGISEFRTFSKFKFLWISKHFCKCFF